MAPWLRQIDGALTAKTQRPVVGYAFAFCAVLAAALIELAFKDVFRGNPYHLFWVTVILAAWYGGVGPGILASLFSVAVVNILLFPNALNLSVDNVVPTVLFVASCLFLSVLRQRQIASTQVLGQQREQLNAILTSIDDAVVAADDSGRVIFINPLGEHLLGVSQGAAVGRSLLDILPVVAAATNQPARGIIETLVASRRAATWRRDLMLAVPNRPIIPLDYTVTPLQSHTGRFDGTVLIFHDASEQRLLEQRDLILRQLAIDLSSALTPSDVALVILQSARALFGDIFGGVFRISESGSALERLASLNVNPTFEQEQPSVPLMVSWPITDAVLQNTIIRIESQDEYIRRYPQFETEIRAENVHAAICLPFELEHRVIGAMHISFRHDVTLRETDRGVLLVLAQLCAHGLARANLYEREQAARKVAEEANETKLRFLGMISHELRTPLTSIKGFLSTLLMTDVAWQAEQQREFLTVVDQEADRLTYLVNQLLDLSRIQAGRFAIKPEPIALQSILSEMQARLTTVAAQHPLEIDAPPDLTVVVADRERIGQVLANLVGNAEKFAPPDSSIRISARQDGDFICVTVSDEGPGIPPEDQDKVFEAFRQLGNTSGTGLGLAICKGIIEAHGGHIWIDTLMPRGATVCFTLPVVGASEPVEPAA